MNGRHFIGEKTIMSIPVFNLFSVNGSDGFRLDGEHAGDSLGASVSSAGECQIAAKAGTSFLTYINYQLVFESDCSIETE